MNSMTLLQEYKNSLKMAEVEEYLDLIFYRPVAFMFVKSISHLPVTPNQITLLSLVAGLASAYCFSLGTTAGFTVAGIWYATANLLDCADGMLARLQNSGTPLGRVVDGIVDWIISVAIFLGVGIGVSAWTGNPLYWYLVSAGGLTSALHAIVFDYYQQRYIDVVRGNSDFLGRERTKAETELATLRGHPLQLPRRTMLRIYLAYMSVQQRTQGETTLAFGADPGLFRQHNRFIMRWWTLLGATTNRTLLVVASLLGDPTIFLWLVIIPGNMYLMIMLFWQRRVQHRMEAATNDNAPFLVSE